MQETNIALIGQDDWLEQLRTLDLRLQEKREEEEEGEGEDEKENGDCDEHEETPEMKEDENGYESSSLLDVCDKLHDTHLEQAEESVSKAGSFMEDVLFDGTSVCFLDEDEFMHGFRLTIGVDWVTHMLECVLNAGPFPCKEDAINFLYSLDSMQFFYGHSIAHSVLERWTLFAHSLVRKVLIKEEQVQKGHEDWDVIGSVMSSMTDARRKTQRRKTTIYGELDEYGMLDNPILNMSCSILQGYIIEGVPSHQRGPYRELEYRDDDKHSMGHFIQFRVKLGTLPSSFFFSDPDLIECVGENILPLGNTTYMLTPFAKTLMEEALQKQETGETSFEALQVQQWNIEPISQPFNKSLVPHSESDSIFFAILSVLVFCKQGLAFPLMVANQTEPDVFEDIMGIYHNKESSHETRVGKKTHVPHLLDLCIDISAASLPQSLWKRSDATKRTVHEELKGYDEWTSPLGALSEWVYSKAKVDQNIYWGSLARCIDNFNPGGTGAFKAVAVLQRWQEALEKCLAEISEEARVRMDAEANEENQISLCMKRLDYKVVEHLIARVECLLRFYAQNV